MFEPPRDRDAYASIRGYMFQIDRTIDQWLTLEANQTLELERGEDIDLVSQLLAIGAEATAESRLLEQIKHRETSITLRTPSSIEAIVNFWDHRRTNLEVDLRFRFLTNAVIGVEQLSPFGNHVAGITLWEQIRSRELDDSDVEIAVPQLREFLAVLPRPEAIPPPIWVDWQAFLSDAQGEGGMGTKLRVQRSARGCSTDTCVMRFDHGRTRGTGTIACSRDIAGCGGRI